ncbi:MAG: ABC transporter permease [Alphaproteobacteria bacterium]|nr:ABC transporter permease [Alphaproteobacteria bacterium]
MSLALPFGAPRPVLLMRAGLISCGLIAIILAALVAGPQGAEVSAANRLLPPSLAAPFGTDLLGRDMLARTLAGLGLSLRTGLLAAGMAAVLGLGFGLLAALGGRLLDRAVAMVIDLLLGLPHLVLLILVAVALGGGADAVVIAVGTTHWPRLARLVRAEVQSLLGAAYVRQSRRFGRSRWWIARHHLLPHLVPQVTVGFVLMFPHAILHEAGLSFLGFGLEPHLPAIGVILAESMRALNAGAWWLAALPGLALLCVVLGFDRLGNDLAALLRPEGRAG